MVVRREMRNLAPGDTLTVKADDPSTARDFELLCTHMGYKMIKKDLNGPVLSFIMQK